MSVLLPAWIDPKLLRFVMVHLCQNSSQKRQKLHSKKQKLKSCLAKFFTLRLLKNRVYRFAHTLKDWKKKESWTSPAQSSKSTFLTDRNSDLIIDCTEKINRQSLRNNGEWMRFSVEHPLIQGQEIIIGKQNIQVFQRFAFTQFFNLFSSTYQKLSFLETSS